MASVRDWFLGVYKLVCWEWRNFQSVTQHFGVVDAEMSVGIGLETDRLL